MTSDSSRVGTKTEVELKAYLEERRGGVDEALGQFLPLETAEPGGLHEAMRYSLFAGGKRIRPILAIGASEALGGLTSRVVPVASAIELIHTYSLIHDDLPAMDDDDFRRGRPTSHKKFGEATAILAGDALLTAAFGMVDEKGRAAGFPPEILLSVIRELAEASGSEGMVGGQYADIISEGRAPDSVSAKKTLEYIHSHKTGRLIRASVRVGALLAGADKKAFDSLSIYGEKLGLAFQVVDDILDVEGTAEETGKSVQKDGNHEKMTYPGVMGLEESKRFATLLKDESLDALSAFGGAADPLRWIARYIIERKN